MSNSVPPSMDSNYSSMNNMEQSSYSSFSLYSSSNSGEASTSGCSSGVGLQQRHDKKLRVKETIKQIKDLVASRSKERKTKTGTLQTLQHVLDTMKKIKEAEDNQITENLTIDTELVGGVSECDNIVPWDSKGDQGWFKVVMSLKENVVLQASEELMAMLGYPKNYWFNQALIDYLYKRDVVTVSSNLSVSQNFTKQGVPAEGKRTAATGKADVEQNVFFFRLRHYKSLRTGFSLSRPEKYSVFCGKASVQTVNLNFPPGTGAEGLQADNKYLVLECTLLQSAYSLTQKLPEQRFFSTRHTVYCNYNFVHPSAIPLLGYLPQDMIGTSVFNYYHPDDLPLMENIYKKVAALPGKTFKSLPYRLKAKNGDYIVVETEWSSFVNPWTKHLDFIIGQHQIIQGPRNVDIFSEGRKHTSSTTNSAKDVQIRIKNILLHQVSQPAQSSITRAGSPGEPLANLTLGGPTRGETVIQKETRKGDASAQQEHFTDETKKQEIEGAQEVENPHPAITITDPCGLYDQLNYMHAIKRFLQSWTSSTATDSREGSNIRSSSEECDEATCDDDDSISVDVDLPILPKQTSVASSTKALISEQEQREEMMPPSPSINEDMLIQIQEEICPPVKEADKPPLSVNLTVDNLRIHDKFQEKNYISKWEKSGIVFSKGTFLRGIDTQPSGGKKRGLMDAEDKNTAKYLRQDNGEGAPQRNNPTSVNPTSVKQMLLPPFPMTTFKTSCTTTNTMLRTQPSVATHPTHSYPRPNLAVTTEAGQVPTTSAAFSSRPNVLPSNLRTMYAVGSASHGLMQMPMNIHPTSCSIGNPPSTTAVNYQLSYYPQRGIYPVQMPQIIYQPIFPAMTTHGTEAMTTNSPHTAAGNQNTEQLQRKEDQQSKSPVKNGENSDSMSLEDTSSSLLYLLDSGSQMYSSPSEEDGQEVTKSKKKINDPPWLQTVQWNEDLQMRYMVAPKEMKRTLKEDKKALKKMNQPAIVTEQLSELLSGVLSEDAAEKFYEEGDMMFMVPEECDFLCSPDQEDFGVDDEDNISEQDHLKGMEAMNLCTSHQVKLEGNIMDTSDLSVEKESIEEVISVESDKSCPPQNEKMDKEERASSQNFDSSETVSSKGSSELTPSDQRSPDVAVSSIKESDNSSSISAGSIEDSGKDMKAGSEESLSSESESDSKLNFEPTASDYFSVLFSPLRLRKNSSRRSMSWSKTSMYKNQTETEEEKQQKEIMEKDQRKLERVEQSDLVNEQLQELLDEQKFPDISESEEFLYGGNDEIGNEFKAVLDSLPRDSLMIENVKDPTTPIDPGGSTDEGMNFDPTALIYHNVKDSKPFIVPGGSGEEGMVLDDFNFKKETNPVSPSQSDGDKGSTSSCLTTQSNSDTDHRGSDNSGAKYVSEMETLDSGFVTPSDSHCNRIQGDSTSEESHSGSSRPNHRGAALQNQLIKNAEVFVKSESQLFIENVKDVPEMD